MSDLAVWRAATAPNVDVQRVAWPELSALAIAVQRLRPYDQTTPIVGRVMVAVWAVRRTLMSTPLPPNDDAVQLPDLIRHISEFLAEHPAHSAADALRAALVAATTLQVSVSPLAQWVGDVLSEYGTQQDGRPEAVLVVPRNRLVDPVRAWLREEELTCVDVATMASLRDKCDHDAALVLGHPGVTYSTSFSPPTLAAREAGWLLTAPPALSVRLALLSDDPPLTARDVWVWPNATAHPRWQLNVPARATASFVQTEWFAEPPAAPAKAVWPHGTSDEDVPATAVITASGHTIYFSPDTGARPRFLGLEDTGEITISTVTITQLRPGRVLIEHTSSAARDALNARADQWLINNKHWTRERITAARDGSQGVKWIVLYVEMKGGKDGLVDDLVHTGLDRSYARGMVERVLGDEYIAPRPKGLDALLRVGGRVNWDYPAPPQRNWLALARDARDDLSTLRTAHQHAGDMIHRDLRARLRDRAWEDDVTVQGWASVNDPTLGDVLLTTAVAIDGSHHVPRSWLGVPKTPDNR